MNPEAVKAHIDNLPEDQRKAFLNALARKPKEGWAKHLTKGQEVSVWDTKAIVESVGRTRVVLKKL